MPLRFLPVLVAVAWLVAGSPSFAQSLAKPTGPVVLTVTGKIAQTNRGPFDPERDALFKNTKTEFQRAASFDLAMLERLGLRAVRADWPKGGAVSRFEGPLLRDVLKAVGAEGATLRVAALDGYSQEIAVRDVEAHPVILALKRDGGWLDLGGFGPAWIVFPRLNAPALKDQGDEPWVWGVIHIAVE